MRNCNYYYLHFRKIPEPKYGHGPNKTKCFQTKTVHLQNYILRRFVTIQDVQEQENAFVHTQLSKIMTIIAYFFVLCIIKIFLSN